MTILFRPFGELVPPKHAANQRWQVEYYPDGEDVGYPVGLAWVMEVPLEAPHGPYLLFVLVEDRFRRQGIATKLVKACQERWPRLRATGAISEAGEALEARCWPK